MFHFHMKNMYTYILTHIFRFWFPEMKIILQSIFKWYIMIQFWQFSIFHTSSCKPMLHWAARHSTLYVDGYTLYFYMVFMFYSLPPMYSGMYVYLLLKLRAKGDMKISCDNKGRCNVSNKLSYQQCEFSDHWQIFCTMYA